MSEHQQTGCKLYLRDLDDVGVVEQDDMQMIGSRSEDDDAVCQKCLQKKVDSNHVCEMALAQKVKQIEDQLQLQKFKLDRLLQHQ